MLAFLAALFIGVSLVEIYLFVLVGQAIGALNTIALVILISFVGAWLTKREGLGLIPRIRAQLDAGRMPTDELVDGVLILAGGIMLVVPGFITDACGLLLLFPPTRAVARRVLRSRFRVYTFRSRPGYAGPNDDVIDV
jgi:UPF0716 protein FxsA